MTIWGTPHLEDAPYNNQNQDKNEIEKKGKGRNKEIRKRKRKINWFIRQTVDKYK